MWWILLVIFCIMFMLCIFVECGVWVGINFVGMCCVLVIVDSMVVVLLSFGEY